MAARSRSETSKESGTPFSLSFADVGDPIACSSWASSNDAMKTSARKGARVIVSSVEGPEDALKTQDQFPHLMALADQSEGLADAVGVIHAGTSPQGGNTSA